MTHVDISRYRMTHVEMSNNSHHIGKVTSDVLKNYNPLSLVPVIVLDHQYGPHQMAFVVCIQSSSDDGPVSALIAAARIMSNVIHNLTIILHFCQILSSVLYNSPRVSKLYADLKWPSEEISDCTALPSSMLRAGSSPMTNFSELNTNISAGSKAFQVHIPVLVICPSHPQDPASKRLIGSIDPHAKGEALISIEK